MSEEVPGARRVARASAAFGVAGVAANLGQIAYTAVTARAIGPAGFAPYAAALLALNLGALASTAGLTSAITRAHEWSREKERGLTTMALALGTVCALAMFTFASLWDTISGVAGSGDIVRDASPLAIVTPVGLIGMTLVRREGRGTRAAAIEASSQLSGFVIGAVAVVVSRSTASLLVALYASTLVSFTLSWLSLGRLPGLGPMRHARAEIGFSLRMVPLGFGSFILLQTPTLWAGRHLSTDQYARYFRGALIDTIPALQLSGAVTKAAAPELRTVQESRLARTVTEVIGLSWALAVISLGVLAGAADPVVRVLLGPAWDGTGIWMVVLALPVALSVPANLLATVAEFTANYRALYVSQALAFVTMVSAMALMTLSPAADYAPAAGMLGLYGGLVAYGTWLQREDLEAAAGLRDAAVHLAVGVSAFALMRTTTDLGGLVMGQWGQIVGAVVGGLITALLLALVLRRLPLGRVLAGRDLVPSWIPGRA